MENERHREIDSTGNLWAWSAKAVNDLPHLHAVIARGDAARGTGQKAGPRWQLSQFSEWNDASNRDRVQPDGCPEVSNSKKGRAVAGKKRSVGGAHWRARPKRRFGSTLPA